MTAQIAVYGRLEVNRWQTSGGEDREDLQVIVDALVSARGVRPGGRRKQTRPAASKPQAREPDFEDEIAF